MTVQQFYQPATEAELVQALQQIQGPGCHIVAGGTDFLAQRNGHHWQAETLLSLTAMTDLQQIQQHEGYLEIGAATPHALVAAHPLVQQHFPALAKACSDVGSAQIRNRGTIGGNLANASPAGDTIPCLFLLEAQVELLNAQGQKRLLPVREFLLGPGKTALTAGEALTLIRLPWPPAAWQNGFWKLGTRSKVTISQIILTAAWQKDAAGNLNGLRLYIGSISLKPLFIEEAPALLGAACPLGPEARAKLSAHLRELIQRVTPAHFDRDYKMLAVQGLVADLCAAINAS